MRPADIEGAAAIYRGGGGDTWVLIREICNGRTASDWLFLDDELVGIVVEVPGGCVAYDPLTPGASVHTGGDSHDRALSELTGCRKIADALYGELALLEVAA